MSTTPRPSLRGLPLTGRRARIRWILVLAIGIAGLVCAFGFGLGRFRDLPSDPDRLGEWHSLAAKSGFVPVLLGAAIVGLAWVVRRDPLPGGLLLGMSAVIATMIVLSNDPYDGTFGFDVFAQAGALGNLLMFGFGVLMLVAEPSLTWLERRALGRPAPLPRARVVH